MKIKLIVLFAFLSVNVMGQAPVTTPEEMAKKKEINALKKNGEAYYADMYHEIKAEESDLVEAQKRSKEMLQAHVIEIFSKRMGMSKQDVRDIWTVLEKNCQNIVVKRGDLFRVFTYVMKNAINPNASVEAVESVETPVAAAPAPQPQQPEVKVDTVAVAPSTPVVLPQAPQSEVKVDSVVAQPIASPVPAEPAVVSETKPVQKLEPKPEPKPVVQPEPEPTPIPVVEVEVPLLCQKLIEKGSFDKVYRYLQQEKTYQRLMYGSARTMQRPEKCYIVLTDKTSGSIVAVLDKGETDRMNFVTKKMDRFRNYEGGNYRAIFVQEY